MVQHGSDDGAQVPRAEAIGRLNDQLRKTGTGGTIVVTRGVAELDGFDQGMVDTALANYDAFNPDNDPHGERDFGDLTLFKTDLLWKIDYYDADLKYGSDDPADQSRTKRALTIMLASEW